MLTRLEVHGFKNLLNFSVDFGPFNCIAGPNGVGKSNIFDAIRFLSLLTDHSLMQAAFSVREAGEPEDIFWTDGNQRIDSMKLAAEMIVDKKVQDDFGRPAEATSTFLRYEIEIRYEEPKIGEKLGRLILLSEQLDYFPIGQALGKLRFAHSVKKFRKKIVINKRRGSSRYISTKIGPNGQIEILMHPDGSSSGRPQRVLATTAKKTVVGATNSSLTPTILAARREMQQWRLLALEPSAMRSTDRFNTDPHITSNGGHLPATLRRLTTSSEDSTNGAEDVYARLANRLSEILPVRNVRVNMDEAQGSWVLEVQEISGTFFPTRSLSDGTLRFLVLSILEQDPEFQGLLCIEEPENGIHPARMPALVELLQDLTVDTEYPPGPENPLRQVIVATHSPYFVQLQNPDDVLYAHPTKVIGPSGTSANTVRCLPLKDTWRVTEEEPGVGMAPLLSYLSAPPEAQLTLPFSNSIG